MHDEIHPPILPKYKILRDWSCPWGSTALDEVPPALKNILKEDYSRELEENTSEQQQLWWNHRKTLNQRLRQLLRGIEESWFGSWKCLLLGELLNCKNFESLLEHLVKELRSECKLEVNEGLVRVILGGTRHVCGREKLKCKKDCYIAKQALIELDADKNSKREPIILVLDYELQMLPWENIPILRQLEVYRMPSVSSISALGDTGSRSQKEAGRKCPSFPSIDPLHAFYILNPDGTVPECQNEFEIWFKENNLKGNTGLAPTQKLWASALEKHDLFIYIGHGSDTLLIKYH
ncbi:separase-like isoform X2 [Arachis stenosperma]|uniref:separase-like isoform X2 n=1 Tax=Arachis stenosperma TaxID=217475 RepID=UPI0025ABD245|nr:separase-like isoform X2 [Arachis stenosperma]